MGTAVGVLFYRSHYLAGNTRAIDGLCEALYERGLDPIPLYVASLRDVQGQRAIADLLAQICQENGHTLGAILNTTSFALGKLRREAGDTVPLWEQLNVPVLQVILSGDREDQWRDHVRGLTPRDLAMNVALPEVDGRLITRAVSFKAVQTLHPQLQTAVVHYDPLGDRLAWVAELTRNIIHCAQTTVGDRKVAIILANYPNRDGRLANGVGLDTPASCLELLKALKKAGYGVGEMPGDTQTLIAQLTQGVTNDGEFHGPRPTAQGLPQDQLWHYFQQLPLPLQTALETRWGDREAWGQLPPVMPVSGVQYGNIFMGIQPSRGYDLDPSLNYHAPDLEPPLRYLAFYWWIHHHFGAQALIHVGKHGNLEWLPGKSVALSSHCYPEVALPPLPHFYPFIVNDPGEGTQAKRRAHACIVDHLTPPLTRAELYGDLQRLEGLIDEYYEAQALDPQRLPVIGDRLRELLATTRLTEDLGLTLDPTGDITPFLTLADSYLCELKEAQIRDGLHILGQVPPPDQLRDLTLSIARSPDGARLGLTQAMAQDWDLPFDPIHDPLDTPFSLPPAIDQQLRHQGQGPLADRLKQCRLGGEVVEVLETIAQGWVGALISSE